MRRWSVCFTTLSKSKQSKANPHKIEPMAGGAGAVCIPAAQADAHVVAPGEAGGRTREG